MLTDAELLHRYVTQREDRAFAELVHRHLGIVYAAALRRCGGRAHLAEEIAQSVFIDLARKSSRLLHHPSLVGWLYRSTRYATTTALRAELSRQKLAQSFTAMPNLSSSHDVPVNWNDLQPLLDRAMDQLKERDRQVMLLRYFQGLSFAEVGGQLNLTENTARMRAERALDRLRTNLRPLGITSTAAALELCLANSSIAAAPAGMVAAISTASLSATPHVSVISVLLMSKITAPIICALVAAGATLFIASSVVPGISAQELAALRQENARLLKATAPGADAESIAAVANEIAARTAAIAEAVDKRLAQRAASRAADATGLSAKDSSRPENRGQATPHDALLSFAWASHDGEVAALSKLLWFDPAGRTKALDVLHGMPASIQAEYDTPEKLYAFILAADALVYPPPGPDILAQSNPVEVAPGRVAMLRPGLTDPRGANQFQETPEGWKYVIPDQVVSILPQNLNNPLLIKGTAP